MTGLELRAEIRGFRRLVFGSEPPRFCAFLFTRKAATETFGDISIRFYGFLLTNALHFHICLNILATAAFNSFLPNIAAGNTGASFTERSEIGYLQRCQSL